MHCIIEKTTILIGLLTNQISLRLLWTLIILKIWFLPFLVMKWWSFHSKNHENFGFWKVFLKCQSMKCSVLQYSCSLFAVTYLSVISTNRHNLLFFLIGLSRFGMIAIYLILHKQGVTQNFWENNVLKEYGFNHAST